MTKLCDTCAHMQVIFMGSDVGHVPRCFEAKANNGVRKNTPEYNIGVSLSEALRQVTTVRSGNHKPCGPLLSKWKVKQ